MDGDGMSVTTSETAEELSEELFAVAVDTVDDGVVEAEIKEFDKTDRDNIEVVFRLPSGRTITEVMSYPEVDDSRYKFVRLCRSAGFSLTGVEQVPGSRVQAETEDGDWKLIAPKQETKKDKLERVARNLFFGGGLVFAFAIAPLAVPVALYFDDDDVPGWSLSDDIGVWVAATTIWMMSLFVVTILSGLV